VIHGRTAALAVTLLGALAGGSWAQTRWPEARPALDCPAEAVGWVAAGAGGMARCGAKGVPPASVRAALGLRLALNRVAQEDLARLPGVGPVAAHALVQARPFRSWDEVDAVHGVGPARLRLLQQATELDP
jgi:competence protein ComEA